MPLMNATTTPSELFPRNSMRRSFVIQNQDSVSNIFIKRERTPHTTVSLTDHDHRIGPGGAIALNWVNDGSSAIQDRWTIIAAAGTPLIAWFETEEIAR